MKLRQTVVIFILTTTLVVAQAKKDKVKARTNTRNNDNVVKDVKNINVQSLNVITQIQARFATTLIICKIRNDAQRDQEVTFTATLPDAAFISNFTMLILSRVIVADVKEKAAAKLQYDIAKSKGESAGHVAQKPRETNTFQISVNVASQSEVVFNLTYQEILKRVHGVYKHVVNLQPDQPVDRMQVDVYITENGEIRNIKVPKFDTKTGEKTNKELLQMPEEKNYIIQKNIKDKISTVRITFKPPPDRNTITNGQFVVLYDVNRDKTGGDIQVVNGYFVHFMAPEGLQTGNKYVIFVLDKSGSMTGRKIEQLKDAMKAILSDLDPRDIFNIIMFSTDVTVWKTESVLASSNNIQAAKDFVSSQTADGSTALNDAILKSIDLLKAGKLNALAAMIMFMTDGQPTVGETDPATIVKNVDSANTNKYSIHCMAFGEDADYQLLQKISSRHRGLARKIYEDSDAALQLTGFYDEVRSPILTEVQITYLNDAVDVNSLVQQNQLITYYDGGEIVTLGRLKNIAKPEDLKATVKGKGANGVPVTLDSKMYPPWVCPMYPDMGMVAAPFARCCPYNPTAGPVVPKTGNSRVVVMPTKCCFPDCCWGYYDTCVPPPTTPPPSTVLPANTAGGFIERMWAYQTIKKYLKQVELEDASSSSLKQKALDLSLKYHFVTELTSMVVTDPSQRLPPNVDSNRVNQNTASTSETDRAPPGRKTISNSGSGGATGTGVSGGNQNSKGISTTDNGNKAVAPVKPNPQPPPNPSPNTVSKGSCNLDVVMVMDLSGDNSNLAKKLIDALASKFSQTTRMAVVLVGSNSNGKANLIQSIVPIVSNAATLKDATRKTATFYNSDVSSLAQNSFSNVNSQSILFLTGSQSLQYAKDAVRQLKQKYSKVKIIAVSTGGQQNSKSLDQVTESSQNSFVSPEAGDLADALNCS